MIARREYAPVAARHDKAITHKAKQDLWLTRSGTVGTIGTITGATADAIAGAVQLPIEVSVGVTTWVSLWAR